MHRTQIMLEERQYKVLKDLAEKGKKSLSRVLREILDVCLVLSIFGEIVI